MHDAAKRRTSISQDVRRHLRPLGIFPSRSPSTSYDFGAARRSHGRVSANFPARSPHGGGTSGAGNLMGRFTRLGRIAAAAVFAAAAFVPSAARASDATDDNDELVAGPEFKGFPDKDTHSGLFLDLIAVGSSSLVQPAYFGVKIPADQTTLRLAVFDGNVGGL